MVNRGPHAMESRASHTYTVVFSFLNLGKILSKPKQCPIHLPLGPLDLCTPHDALVWLLVPNLYV